MYQLLRGHEIEVNIQLLCTHRAVSRNLFQPRQIPSRPLASPFPALLPPPFPSLPSLPFPGPFPLPSLSPPFSPPPIPSFPPPPSFHSFPSPSPPLPLRSRPPLLRLGGLGERLSSPSGSGRSPAARRFLLHFRAENVVQRQSLSLSVLE